MPPTVILVEPRKPARVAEVENDLSAMQKIVGGDIEAVYPWSDKACIVCNDSGKLEGLPLNRSIGYDIIAGTFFVCGLTVDDFGSLNEQQIKTYYEKFHHPEAFIDAGDKIYCMKLVTPDTAPKKSSPQKPQPER